MITTETLQRIHAYEDQVRIFEDTFPEGVQIPSDPDEQVTLSKVFAKAGFELDWVARRLLPPKHLAIYKKASAPAKLLYQETELHAWVIHDDTVTRAKAILNDVEQTSRAIYDEAVTRDPSDEAKALVTFKGAYDSALEVYEQTKQETWDHLGDIMELALYKYLESTALAFMRAATQVG